MTTDRILLFVADVGLFNIFMTVFFYAYLMIFGYIFLKRGKNDYRNIIKSHRDNRHFAFVNIMEKIKRLNIFALIYVISPFGMAYFALKILIITDEIHKVILR